MTKKSFILYKDQWDVIQKLSLEQKGLLLETVFKFVRCEEIPEIDPLTDLVFTMIKSQLLRDKETWDEEIEKRREAGRLGGLAKAHNAKQPLANLASASNTKQPLANLGDNVTVNVTVTDNVIKDKKEYSSDFESFWKEYPHRDTDSKAAAYKAWDKAKDKPGIEELLDRVRYYKSTDTVKKGFQQMAATWLNQKGWTIEVKPSIATIEYVPCSYEGCTDQATNTLKGKKLCPFHWYEERDRIEQAKQEGNHG